MHATFDKLLWQSLASVFIPGATIHGIVKATRWSVTRIPVVASTPILYTWLPTGTGLISIPWIVHPIDELVDTILNHSIRQWWPTPSLPPIVVNIKNGNPANET
jgi:hypothetical protein